METPDILNRLREVSGVKTEVFKMRSFWKICVMSLGKLVHGVAKNLTALFFRAK
jgi:hypothetical protein